MFVDDIRFSAEIVSKKHFPLKGLFHPACLARIVSWFASVVSTFMAYENYDRQRPTKRQHVQGMLDETDPLKGLGHVTVNKPVFSKIYIVAHTCPLCSARVLVDGMNPQ